MIRIDQRPATFLKRSDGYKGFSCRIWNYLTARLCIFCGSFCTNPIKFGFLIYSNCKLFMPVLHDLRTPACFVIFKSLFNKMVKPTGFHIFFDLLIPCFFFRNYGFLKHIWQFFLHSFGSFRSVFYFGKFSNRSFPTIPIFLDICGIGLIKQFIINITTCAS